MSDTADTIEQKCLAKGVKLTEQEKLLQNNFRVKV